MSTESQITQDDFLVLILSGTVNLGSFLQKLPLCKEELGLVKYATLIEMGWSMLSPANKALYVSKIPEGFAAHNQGTPWENNPYHPYTNWLENAGWAFGWTRGGRRP